jgi:hypothetical protein
MVSCRTDNRIVAVQSAAMKSNQTPEPRLKPRTRCRSVPCLAFALFWLAPLHADDAVPVIYQCVAADGSPIYSDRRCGSMGVTERIPRRVPGRATACITRNGEPCTERSSQAVRHLRLGCPARSPESLRLAVGDAVASGEFNALSGLYNYANHSGQGAAEVVRRLLRIARRTASHVELVEPALEYHYDETMPRSSGEPVLRVVQYLAGMSGPLTSDDFRLVPAAGCLWLG